MGMIAIEASNDNGRGTHYEIVDSAARMPASCWGRYRRVAVLEVRDGYTATRIDDRPHYVVRIVCNWERLYDGTTDRCAHARALAAARELVQDLMAARDVPVAQPAPARAA
jgi:hypothetical protein